MKAKIVGFINNFIIYDYLLFGGIFLIFILFLAIAIYFRKKLILAIFFVLLAFFTISIGSVFSYVTMHNYLYKNSLQIELVKKLEYSDAVIIKGTITNESKFDFNECTIKASTFSVNNDLLDHLRVYVPFQSNTIKIKKPIKISQNADFKIFIEPFYYKKDFKVIVTGKCR